MLCQKCNKKVATVFISTVINGQNSQMYLCTDCAKEFHESMNSDMKIPFPINDILSNMSFDENTVNDIIKGLKEMETSGGLKKMLEEEHTEENQQNTCSDEVSEEEIDITCSVCNTSFKDYQSTGKLGCSKCYSAFEKQLKPIIEGIYGYSEHIGKFPKNEEFKDVQVIRTVERLKEQLNVAIREEEYEQAAKLRDEILELEANNM